MFQASLIASQSRSGTARLRLLSLAVAVHALLVAGVILAQAWTVAGVPEPQRIAAAFVRFLPPPPPTGGRDVAPRRSPVRRSPSAAGTTVFAAPPTAAQPHRVPDVTSPTPTVAEVTPTSVIPGALPGDDAGPGDAPAGPGGGDLGDLPVEIGAGIVPPTLLHRIVPSYTEAARRAHLQGLVLLQAVIAADGAVTDVRLVRGLGLGLDENAIAAVRGWRYAPARVARTGRVLPVYLTITVRYELRSGTPL